MELGTIVPNWIEVKGNKQGLLLRIKSKFIQHMEIRDKISEYIMSHPSPSTASLIANLESPSSQLLN
jgi:hypothetical protein